MECTKYNVTDLMEDPKRFQTRDVLDRFPHIAEIDGRKIDPPMSIEHVQVVDNEDYAHVDVSAWADNWMVGIQLSKHENQSLIIEWRL